MAAPMVRRLTLQVQEPDSWLERDMLPAAISPPAAAATSPPAAEPPTPVKTEEAAGMTSVKAEEGPVPATPEPVKTEAAPPQPVKAEPETKKVAEKSEAELAEDRKQMHIKAQQEAKRRREQAMAKIKEAKRQKFEALKQKFKKDGGSSAAPAPAAPADSNKKKSLSEILRALKNKKAGGGGAVKPEVKAEARSTESRKIDVKRHIPSSKRHQGAMKRRRLNIERPNQHRYQQNMGARPPTPGSNTEYQNDERVVLLSSQFRDMEGRVVKYVEDKNKYIIKLTDGRRIMASAKRFQRAVPVRSQQARWSAGNSSGNWDLDRAQREREQRAAEVSAKRDIRRQKEQNKRQSSRKGGTNKPRATRGNSAICRLPDSLTSFEPNLDPGQPTGRVYMRLADWKDDLDLGRIKYPEKALQRWQHIKSGQCNYCGFWFKNINMRVAHQKQCIVKPYTQECFFCRASFTGTTLDGPDSVAHNRQKHQSQCYRNPQKRTCKYCDKLFPSFEAKGAHVKFPGCSKDPQWLPRPCPHCNQMMKNMKALITHYKRCVPYQSWKAAGKPPR